MHKYSTFSAKRWILDCMMPHLFPSLWPRGRAHATLSSPFSWVCTVFVPLLSRHFVVRVRVIIKQLYTCSCFMASWLVVTCLTPVPWKSARPSLTFCELWPWQQAELSVKRGRLCQVQSLSPLHFQWFEIFISKNVNHFDSNVMKCQPYYPFNLFDSLAAVKPLFSPLTFDTVWRVNMGTSL